MFRILIILIPLVACVGATVVALKLPSIGSEEEHFKKLVFGSIAAGLVFSGITWWQADAGWATRMPRIATSWLSGSPLLIRRAA